MKILAIETATEACSAALLIDDVVIDRHEIAPRGHSSLILPMMDELLAEAELSLSQLDGLAFGRGPGSFTGVRIATGVIQGAAFAADLPVVPVSTLAAMAHGAYRTKGCSRVLAAIDARMSEVYWGAYHVSADHHVELQNEEQVIAAEQVCIPIGSDWYGVGSGWATYESVLSERLGDALASVDTQTFPHASDVAFLGAVGLAAGEAVSAEQVLPVYLRNNVAKKKAF